MQARINPLTGGLEHVELCPPDLTALKSLLHRLNTTPALNPAFNPQPSKLSLQDKIQKALSVAIECQDSSELPRVFQKTHPICYDGFEPSGRMHIAQGVLKALNVNKLVECGCIFIFWIADWFAMLNNKMGGDLDKIRVVGEYFVEVWKALGMKMENVKFLWASDEIEKNGEEYWGMVMDIARKFPLARIQKCATILGRSEKDDLAVAQLMYPCMQCTDVFYLKADICQLGLDQRKVNMLAREYCDKKNIKDKPVILKMLSGLKEGQEKMSKSDPESAIFMEDTEQDVKNKIKKAFCPLGIVNGNPIMDYVKNIIFGARTSFTIQRKKENGGDVTYTSYIDLEQDYIKELIHPGDLKPSVAIVLNELIQPVRNHFNNNPRAKKILEQVRSFTVTR